MRGRTARHAGCAVSLRCCERLADVFGWIEVQAGLGTVKLSGRSKVAALFPFAAAADALVRPPELLAPPAAR